MLPDVGMVQMYSKSANVNDLHGFCVDRLAPLFAWTGPPPCSYGFSASWFAMPFRGTLHHPYICPCFWRKHFYTPPIYNGAKPEYPCSVFLAAFSVLRRENGEVSYTALRPTSIRFSRDSKTATHDASAKTIGEIPLRQPCFPTPSLPKVAKEREVAVQRNAMVCIEAHRTHVCNW